MCVGGRKRNSKKLESVLIMKAIMLTMDSFCVFVAFAGFLSVVCYKILEIIKSKILLVLAIIVLGLFWISLVGWAVLWATS
jgi:hypothetical protein